LKHIQVNDDFVETDSDESVADVTLRLKDSCLSEQPMKDAHTVQRSPVCPDFYPLEHDTWENDIIWNNSPSNDHQPYAKICESEESVDTHGEDQGKDYGQASRCWDLQSKSNGSPVIEEPFHCTEMPAPANYHSPGNNHPPLTNEDNLDHIIPNNLDEAVKTNTLLRLNNLSLLNRELLEGSWLDDIIWDPTEGTPKPKLIFDLKDDHMLFEILDEKNVDHLRSHARAMIVSQSMKTSTRAVENFDSQAKTLSGRFNISNDKFYSNRKAPQQAKSHTKKRALMGIKVVHSAPAHKLQTMKPVLSRYEASPPSCQILNMCNYDFSSCIVLQACIQMNFSCFLLLIFMLFTVT
jgi:transcription initiation factor TFIID subunit 1